MKVKFINEIDHHQRINFEKLIGKVTVDEIVRYRNEKVNSPDYIDTYNILLDITEAEIVDFMDNMHRYINFLAEISGKINMKRKYAILTSKPMDVVHSEIFIGEMDKLRLGVDIKIFSVKKNALYWLSH